MAKRSDHNFTKLLFWSVSRCNPHFTPSHCHTPYLISNILLSPFWRYMSGEMFCKFHFVLLHIIQQQVIASNTLKKFQCYRTFWYKQTGLTNYRHWQQRSAAAQVRYGRDCQCHSVTASRADWAVRNCRNLRMMWKLNRSRAVAGKPSDATLNFYR